MSYAPLGIVYACLFASRFIDAGHILAHSHECCRRNAARGVLSGK
jgi:hypothetical protein